MANRSEALNQLLSQISVEESRRGDISKEAKDIFNYSQSLAISRGEWKGAIYADAWSWLAQRTVSGMQSAGVHQLEILTEFNGEALKLRLKALKETNGYDPKSEVHLESVTERGDHHTLFVFTPEGEAYDHSRNRIRSMDELQRARNVVNFMRDLSPVPQRSL